MKDEPIPWRDPKPMTLETRVVAAAEVVVLMAALGIEDESEGFNSDL